jgi:FkbM family methyltransferase
MKKPPRSLLDRAAVAIVRGLPVGYFRVAKALAKLRPALRSYSINTHYGPLVCDLSERICVPLWRDGAYAHWKDDEAVIARLPLSRGSLVVDIGANVGATVSMFASRVGHVHAFEPAPRALRLLRANHWTNVTIHPVALTNHDGTTFFEESASLDVSHISSSGIEVEARTLDSFGLQPDVIKIDVEGFEPQVLAGAVQTLRHSPIVMFEALDEESRAACEKAILTANASYRFERISDLNYVAWPKS